MSDLLQSNLDYWKKGYHSPNVDSYVFRFFGRILKPEYGMPRQDPQTVLLDFGCGQGAAVNYFRNLGFNAYGLDCNQSDIDMAQNHYPDCRDYFRTIPSDSCELTSLTDLIEQESIDVITSCQVLYYLPKKQFRHFIELCYDNLPKGGLFYATMMSVQEEVFYGNSTPVGGEDDWMRCVEFEMTRYNVEDYYMHFIKDEEDLVKKFEPFKPVHIGEYMNRFHSEDGNGHHYTFFGIKE